MEDFTKVVRVGLVDVHGGRRSSLFCEIVYKDGKLSIHGVIGPMPSGNCIGSCGQIQDELKAIDSYARGWNNHMTNKLRMIWDEWHLNHIKAGTPVQENYLKQHGLRGKVYSEKCEALKSVGLYEVTLEDGTLYEYGTKWLTREVPQDVLEWLYMLPDADRTPAWV